MRRDGICILPFISGVRSDASGGMLRPFFKRRELCRRRKEELRLQFKEAIQIVASALAAGYSVENAFIASVRDLEEQYGKEGMITREFSYLASQLKMNRTVEALLSSFAKRSGLDEVENFSVIFTVSKRSRGELASVVHHVVHVISDRIQVREEILTMTAEKQFEQRIMNLMPYLIVLYVDLSSPGFSHRCMRQRWAGGDDRVSGGLSAGMEGIGENSSD